MTKVKTQNKPTLIKGAENISRDIKAVGKSLKTGIGKVHLIAVSILAHVEEHSNVTLATDLINALPDGTRKNALRAWFLHFGKFSWLEAERKTKTNPGKPARFGFDGSKQTMLEEAMDLPFWDFKKEPEFKPMDVAEAIVSLMKRIQKAQEKQPELVNDNLVTQFEKVADIAKVRAVKK